MFKDILSQGQVKIPSINKLFLKGSVPIKGWWISNRNKTRKTYTIYDTDK
jgi:hypothetical protein